VPVIAPAEEQTARRHTRLAQKAARRHDRTTDHPPPGHRITQGTAVTSNENAGDGTRTSNGSTPPEALMSNLRSLLERDRPSAATETVIDVSALRMRYGSVEAVRGIDLHVRRGEVFAFLGPNGAGKTTAVEILEGYRRRTGGEVTVLGQDPQHAGPAWRARIGVVLQESAAEQDLTAAECLQLYAGYYPAPGDVGETLALVGLSDRAGAMASRLSGGQRRRLDVALALIGDPELLFLDEPTTGFDPSARRAAWDMISRLRELGVTVFLTTHYMDEAEHLADRVAVIAHGQIVAEGTPATLGGREHAAAEIRFSLPPGTTFDELPEPVRSACADKDGNRRLLVRAASPVSVLGPLISWAGARGSDLADLDVRRPSLEDIYLSLTEAKTDGRR
jgi:ABC-2 type transport system ATP-binding protein